MTRRGFTIVELIITVTIMGILLTLAVVNVGSTQANARDEERKADIEAIGNALDRYYKTGNGTSSILNTYPAAEVITSEAALQSFLQDIDLKSFRAPGITNATQSFIVATNAVQTTAGVTPQPTKDQYVYQPITTNGTLCPAGFTSCRKYNLYYRLESNNGSIVYKAMSKNQ